MSALAGSGTGFAGRARPAASYGILTRLERGSLWLLGFGAAFAFVEPSPYEFVFAPALLIFALGGFRLHRSTLVMLVPLALFNLGGMFSLIPFMHDTDSVIFIAVSAYLMVTSVFFAMMVLKDGPDRVAALKNGLVWAGVVASVAGILGYFDVAGLGSLLSVNDRASGTFKDPNVLGTFVILPLVFLAQDILQSRGVFWRNASLFFVILFGGVFLSFSRGAWGHAVVSLALMTFLTFLFDANARIRLRISVLTIIAPVVLVAALGVALSFDEIQRMFETRASLDQYYDVGPTGRFGNHERALPTLLDLPNGYGPRQFRYSWPEDPHNVYINAFASYGWLGGIAYLGLIIATLVIGWRVVAMRFSMRRHAIAIWSVLMVTILQGFIIDTDHWRHFYLALGLIWGFYGLACQEAEVQAKAKSEPGIGSPQKTAMPR